MFISHTWIYHPGACAKKSEFFQQNKLSFEYIEPYALDKDAIQSEDIGKWIKKSDCLLILAGSEQFSESLLEQEITLAQKFGVPIIAIEPWKQKLSDNRILENAEVVVEWHGKKISEAIRSVV